MASDTKSVGAGLNDNSAGSFAWSNPGYIVSSDNQKAAATGTGGDGTTQRLRGYSCGFSIPSGATIDGILLEIERSSSPSGASYGAKDNEVRVRKGAAYSSANRADTTIFWPTTDTYKSYGGSTDLWGESWTPSDVNSSDFGGMVRANIVPVGTIVPTAYVDHMRLTVYYTPSTGGFFFASQIIGAIFALAAPLMHRLGFWQQTRCARCVAAERVAGRC
ncbi:MAG: hypothetical protein QN174_07760 [Armatimonadota bacterium]|nr:hypothetical protein [Armatimonadota bacterium]